MKPTPINVNVAAVDKRVPNFRRVIRDICSHCRHLTTDGTLVRPNWYCAKHNLIFGEIHGITTEFTCSDWDGDLGGVGDLPIPGIAG